MDALCAHLRVVLGRKLIETVVAYFVRFDYL